MVGCTYNITILGTRKVLEPDCLGSYLPPFSYCLCNLGKPSCASVGPWAKKELIMAHFLPGFYLFLENGLSIHIDRAHRKDSIDAQQYWVSALWQLWWRNEEPGL